MKWKPTLLVNINLQKWYFVAFCCPKLTIIADFSLHVPKKKVYKINSVVLQNLFSYEYVA